MASRIDFVVSCIIDYFEKVRGGQVVARLATSGSATDRPTDPPKLLQVIQYVFKLILHFLNTFLHKRRQTRQI